jgi:hypothetical protein
MAVNIHWASDDNGTDITQALDHGNSSVGSTTSEQTIYIYHDGTNDLTSCAFYLDQYSGIYSGGASASEDLEELLGWGDSALAASFGGYQINMDAANSFAAAWPDESNHNVGLTGFVFNNTDSQGDLLANGITLAAAMQSDGLGTAGLCPANPPNGYGTGYLFKARIEVPSNEIILGVRQFDLVMSYSYTS